VLLCSRRQFSVGLAAATVAFPVPGARVRAQEFLPHDTYNLGYQGVLYKLAFAHSGPRQITITAAVLPRSSFRASIVEEHDRAGSLTAVRDVARNVGASVSLNGGRFTGAFAPDGYLLVGGRVIGRKRADWDGYFTVDDRGRPSVTTSPHLSTAEYAVQGYPTLIRAGGVLGVTHEDHVVTRRTVVAQSGDLIIAMVTSPVSLLDLGVLLLENSDAFYLPRFDVALNLSGAATTGLYAKLADGSEFVERSYWPNRDVIVFTPISQPIRSGVSAP